MKKKLMTIATGSFLVAALAGTAFAATSQDTTTKTTAPTVKQNVQQLGKFKDRAGKGFMGGFHHVEENAELLALLGVDAAALKEELHSGKSLADIAAAKKVDVQKVIDIIKNAITKQLTEGVAAGKLTQAQADQFKTDLDARVKDMVEGKMKLQGGHGPKDGKFKGHGGGNLSEAASILGLTEQELHTQLQSGKSLVEIAKAKGISETDLVNKLVEKETVRIKERVNQKWQAPAGKAVKPSTNAAQTPAI